jgi:hypothetical protein
MTAAPRRRSKKKADPRSVPARTDAAVDPRQRKLLDALRADPELAPVVASYEKEATQAGRKFGKNGLKTRDGKLFALFTQGTLVVKLPKQRVTALVDRGVGEPFDPGGGRLMKEWLTVTSTRPSWVELAKEAHDFVMRTDQIARPTRRTSRRS